MSIIIGKTSIEVNVMTRYRRNRSLDNNRENNNESIVSNLSTSMNENIEKIKMIFNNDETIIFRYFESQQTDNIKCYIVFADGMIDIDIINKSIIYPIVNNNFTAPMTNVIDVMKNQVIISNDVSVSIDINELVQSILNGNTVLLLEGSDKALSINTKGWKSRSIEEPEAEKVLRGPREGFTEDIMTNLSMIRRKIKSPELKFKFKTFGERSKTKGCLCYIEGIVNEKILDEINRRLEQINIDGVLDTGYIQELIRDAPFTPFRTIGTTERPDAVAGKILEGRVALILDGSPIALTMPFIFVEYFQASEDYYNNFYFASIGRIIRIIAFMLTISVPALYLALITFHHEIIPTELLISISAARQGMPLPSVVEALTLILVFEILRETGARVPSYIGQALSIVGALVLGQAAVQARFVSAPMVIIIGLSGITGLMTQKIKGAVIIMRIVLLLLASFVGIYGVVFGVMGIIAHLLSIRSFGVMYMSGIGTFNPEDIKDTAIRVPWWYMKYRPRFASMKNQIRQKDGRQ